MTFLDIHAHILPGVDDGAKDVQTAITLLEMMKEQRITHVIATPHFYPDADNAEEFVEYTKQIYNDFIKEIKKPKSFDKMIEISKKLLYR